MLLSIKDMEDCSIVAPDGVVGSVKDYYFDDARFVIRYLVVDTGAWLSGRHVLISPLSIAQPNWPDKSVSVSVTRAQVERSPDIDLHKPVSRQLEMAYLTYYGYSHYWGGGGLWGAALSPNMMLAGPPSGGHSGDDPHLRSANAVMRYYLHAIDGDIGHIDGLIVDETTWALRYLIVNTSNWWLGHEVLIAVTWITDFDWLDSKVAVKLTREAIKNAPAYDRRIPLEREHETLLHDHHGQIGYWSAESKTGR